MDEHLSVMQSRKQLSVPGHVHMCKAPAGTDRTEAAPTTGSKGPWGRGWAVTDTTVRGLACECQGTGRWCAAESRRPEPAPLVLGRGWDPPPGVIPESKRASHTWEEALQGQGSGGCQLHPRLGEGGDSHLMAPIPRPHSVRMEEGSLPRVGKGSRVLPSPSGVPDVPDVPQGCLIHDAAHLLQSLRLADPFQAHLQGLGQPHKVPLHLLAGL